MNVNVISDQQTAGGFKHYITLGSVAPWRADDEDVFECKSEKEAFRIKAMLERHLSNDT